MRDNSIVKRAFHLAEEMKTCLFKNQTSNVAKFLSILHVAQCLAESVLRKNEMAMSSVTVAKKLILDDANNTERMRIMALSELQNQSLIEERLAASVINFAINQSDKDASIDADKFMAEIEMGIELLVRCQPQTDWETKIINRVKKIVRNH